MRIRHCLTKGIRIAVLGFLLLSGGTSLLAQVPGTQADVGGCVACHIGADAIGAKRFVEQNRSHEFVRLSESKTWDSQDPHQLAYEVLKPTNAVAKRMQDHLANGNTSYKLTEDVRCLTCHSTDLKPTSKEPRNVKEFVGSGAGVACAACHGVARDWQFAHYGDGGEPKIQDKAEGKDFEYFKWRTLPPDAKQAAGLRNLRDPHVKADLCASCHVGNPDEGKVVTHEMYAAGHPPLPPLELVTFMEGEPRHWGYPEELKFLKDFGAKDASKAWEIFRFKPAKDDNYLARHVAAGAIASLKAEMKLLAAEAKNLKDGEGLDYARFDCYSCHHDLKYPSPRQDRGYAGRVPGRPPLKAWVSALPSVVASNAGSLDAKVKTLADQLPTAWKTVSADSTAAPFGYGKGAMIAKSANSLATWCDSFSKSLDDVNISDANAEALLAKLKAAIPSNEWSGDTEATMSMLWAYRSLKLGLKQNVDEVDSLAEFIPTHIRDLKKVKAEKSPLAAGVFLPDRLRLFANFNPPKFNEKFQMLK